MTWTDTRLCDLLQIEHPIIQAPMAGASTPEMAVAAANAGALGSLGCALLSVEQATDLAKAAFIATNQRVNLNFFVNPEPTLDPAKSAAAQARLKPWYEALGIDQQIAPESAPAAFNAEMCAAVLALNPQILSFHFGLPDAALVSQIKDAGVTILSSATSAAEAIWLEAHGADAIIAQGYEAGGHNGWFLDRNGSDVAGTFALVPRIVDCVRVPVIAAGGIADGRGVAAALTLGAAGVQVGTAFLATPECQSAEIHKQKVIASNGDETIHSTAFSGRAARTLTNEFARDMADVAQWPDFPLMNAATAPLRKATAQNGTGDAFALWAGQAVGLARAESTGDVVERLVQEARKLLP